ncbi:MAG: hypothetical protein GTN38_03240 [Candidatus Aenigmarchaeota archaeon]|nr:hypothetical protein [Candidatus Aenigmarchaeota archaeon]NIP40676.1 hypothetical protein [Candidatus Aenigmarchaeota archaeon]NIQ18482.1 hypothetical protein [Candidatus Aenigmarchaeota archaeon]NIS73381.1 hypothetical protein [Candidatus Aenigmarchaeota archaeon]
MAVDLFDMLVQILQISPTLVNEYATQGPIYQLFYLFFFPMVFIIILVWMIMERFSRHRGLSILVGIAVLAFIILNGWYNFFAYLSRFWLIIVIILGAIWAFFSFKGKKEGGPAAKGRMGGLERQITGRLYRKAVGVEKELEREVERAINAVERSRGGVETTEAIRIANDTMLKYREAVDIAGIGKFSTKYRKFEERLHKAIKKHSIDMKKVG